MTIAGSDSGAAAGIQADLKTFAAHGVYGLSAVTAVTAQNTVEVSAIHAVPSDVIVAQIEAVVSDIGVDAAKTGMLLSASIVEAVARAIEEFDIPLVVVDPVMVATSGTRLLEEDAVLAIKRALLPGAHVVTPNRMEAEILAGLPIGSLDDAREAAKRIYRLGPAAVVIKGGHLPGPKVIDVLFDGNAFTTFTGPRIDGPHTHGTGCTFAAALAASLALGEPLAEATRAAKRYVEQSIRHVLPLGRGHHPLNHFWQR